MAINISLETLLESGAHFGHHTKRWNPKMKQYLYGSEDGVHIFDLTKTKELLSEALDFIKKASSEGKVILLVGTKKQVKDKIVEVAQATNSLYVSERWLGGTLTNFDQMKRSMKKMQDLRDEIDSRDYKKYTKKERLLMERKYARMERFLGGLKDMAKIPDILFVVDTHKEAGTVAEANKTGVEVVGIVDSNSDPTVIDYIIPMNDDATKALDYVLGLVQDAIITGRKK